MILVGEYPTFSFDLVGGDNVNTRLRDEINQRVNGYSLKDRWTDFNTVMVVSGDNSVEIVTKPVMVDKLYEPKEGFRWVEAPIAFLLADGTPSAERLSMIVGGL